MNACKKQQGDVNTVITMVTDIEYGMHAVGKAVIKFSLFKYSIKENPISFLGVTSSTIEILGLL